MVVIILKLKVVSLIAKLNGKLMVYLMLNIFTSIHFKIEKLIDAHLNHCKFK